MTESTIFRCDEISSFHAASIVQPTAVYRQAVCEELNFKRRRYSDAWLLRSGNRGERCAIVTIIARNRVVRFFLSSFEVYLLDGNDFCSFLVVTVVRGTHAL